MPTSHMWIGGAPKRAKVESITFPDDIAAGQVVNLTVGVKTLEVTAVGSTKSEIIAEVVAAWNASSEPEFSEITASVGTDVAGSEDGAMDMTADVAGKPFAVNVSIGSGNNEVQTVTLSGTAATGGTFTVTFDGQTTGNIAYNADAATFETALEALSNIGSGDATVTGSAGAWVVEFTGALAATNVALMTINTENLTGGVNEVQTISSPSNPTGGTFTLSFGSQTTGNIAYNASSATIVTALEALSNIPAGSVGGSGGSLPGTPVVITFQDELAATDVSLLTVDATNLTGINGSVAETQAGGSDLLNKARNFWDFGDSTPATSDDYKDRVGLSVSASPSGASGWSRVSGGKLGYCLYTSGTSKVKVGSANFANFDGDVDFSIAVWVKFDSLGSAEVIMGCDNVTTYDWYLQKNSDDTFTFVKKGGAGNLTATSTATATAGTWHHVVAVQDATNEYTRISVDGAAFVSSSGSTTLSAASSAYMRLGGVQPSVPGYPGAMSGFIDSIGIFDSALTISEAQSVYNSGAGDDYPFPSAGGNEVQTLTITGTPTAGSVTVSYQGVGVEIPYDATSAEAEALLDTVSTIGAGNTNVTGGDWPGTPLVVEFVNDLAVTDVGLLEIDTSTLTMTVAETTPGVTPPVGTIASTVSPMSQSTTTASSGPNDWDVATNWSTNTVPETGDTVYISETDVSILYGLDQSAFTLAALHIDQTFTGSIGLPRTNTDGTTSYYEYRDSYLKIGATLLNIGDKDGDGSDRIKIDLGSVQSTVLITDSGESPDGNTPPILLLGTHASNVINVNRGTVGVAYYPTEVSTIATLKQAFFDDAADDTTVYLGSGVTIGAIVKSGGVIDINSSTTTISQSGGTLNIHDGAHPALTIVDGDCNYNSTGTGVISIGGTGVLNFNQDRRSKTITSITKNSEECEIYDDSGCIAPPVVVVMNNVRDFSTLHFATKTISMTYS